jgi:glutathione S-transferase
VSLAAGLKGIALEHVVVPDDDRSQVSAASGQDLVPVIEHEGRVIHDSMAILAYLDELEPDPPLHLGRSDVVIFCDWFNRVWKVAPNQIAEKGNAGPWAADMRQHLGWLDRYFGGREELTAADVVAFPFLKYAAGRDPADDETFHVVLDEHQTTDGHPGLAAWIERVGKLPRA